MGKRGPKPTPTAILKLRGSWRGGTPREGEPVAAPEMVPAPAWLSPKAVARWDEICPVFFGWGVMARPFVPALSLLADALADYLEVEEESRGAAWTVDTAEGVKANPLRTEKRKQWDLVMKGLREFGATPSAVTAVRKIEKKEARPLDRFKIGA